MILIIFNSIFFIKNVLFRILNIFIYWYHYYILNYYTSFFSNFFINYYSPKNLNLNHSTQLTNKIMQLSWCSALLTPSTRKKNCNHIKKGQQARCLYYPRAGSCVRVLSLLYYGKKVTKPKTTIQTQHKQK